MNKAIKTIATITLAVGMLTGCANATPEPTPTQIKVATISGSGGVLADPEPTPPQIKVATISGSGGALAETSFKEAFMDEVERTFKLMYYRYYGATAVALGNAPAFSR